MLELPREPADIRAWESVLPIASGAESLEAMLERYGLSLTSAQAQQLVVRAGETVVLSEALPAHMRRTADVAVAKEWIGLPDSLIDLYPLRGLPEAPLTAWPSGRHADPSTFSAAEAEDVRRATNTYLFGDSRRVPSYKTALEELFGPFEVDVYFVPHIEVEAGATLLVRGRPHAILADTITIQPGGRIELRAICKAWIGSMRKLSLVH